MYVRYLDSLAPRPLTQRFAGGVVKVWTAKDRVLLATSKERRLLGESAALWSVSALGGEPEPVMDMPAGTTNLIALTQDGDTVAALRLDENRVWGIWTGALSSGTLQRYEPAPVESPLLVNNPTLAFFPTAVSCCSCGTPSTASKLGSCRIPRLHAPAAAHPAEAADVQQHSDIFVDAGQPPHRHLYERAGQIGEPLCRGHRVGGISIARGRRRDLQPLRATGGAGWHEAHRHRGVWEHRYRDARSWYRRRHAAARYQPRGANAGLGGAR